MTSQKINKDFDISVENLEDKIGFELNGLSGEYNRIVPLRKIKHADSIVYFKENVFEAIIRKISLRGDSEIYPYKYSSIEVFGREPKGLRIGQKFILQEKLISMMHELSTINKEGVFGKYVTKGLSKMPPAQIYGTDEEGKKVIAFYIPPIIEIHGNDAVLIDGIHRSYICGTAGTTINGVHISGTASFLLSPLPFTPINWKETEIVKEKPPISERYKDLNPEYFRDLSIVGIDG